MFSLNLDHEDALDARAANYASDSLRPPKDFPISVTKSGIVLSRYQDDVWDLSPYSPNTRRLHFTKKCSGINLAITNANTETLKRITFWTLYALGVRCSVSSVYVMFYLARTMANICSENGVPLISLSRFPKLIEKLASTIPSSQRNALRRLIYRMVRDADILGFTILTTDQVDGMFRTIGRHRSTRQTLFIPERIYFSLIEKCVSHLTGFLSLEAEFRALYQVCSESYSEHLNKDAVRLKRSRNYSHDVVLTVLEEMLGQTYEDLARSHGVWDEINRTYKMPRHEKPSIRHFGYYLQGIKFSARLLISALTGMRKAEVANLRIGCLEIRDDPTIGKVFFVRGATTKTRKSKNAAWIAAPEVELAIRAATVIVGLNNFAQSLDPRRPTKFEKQLLLGRDSDLWIGVQTPKHLLHIDEEISAPWPRNPLATASLMFDVADMTVTQEDLDQARRLTPNLPDTLGVGGLWPLSWHQFRRTIFCLALGAGVSLPAIAWQAKHTCTAMALHYGRNYFNIDAQPNLSKEFQLAEVEMFLLRSSELLEDRFVSPTDSKAKVIKVISRNDIRVMSKLASEGKSTYRRTLLGYCTNSAPCTHGGWENIASCVACDFALLDTSKRQSLTTFLDALEVEIEECPDKDILLKDSLIAQREAVNRAIKTIT